MQSKHLQIWGSVNWCVQRLCEKIECSKHLDLDYIVLRPQAYSYLSLRHQMLITKSCSEQTGLLMQLTDPGNHVESLSERLPRLLVTKFSHQSLLLESRYILQDKIPLHEARRADVKVETGPAPIIDVLTPQPSLAKLKTMPRTNSGTSNSLDSARSELPPGPQQSPSSARSRVPSGKTHAEIKADLASAGFEDPETSLKYLPQGIPEIVASALHLSVRLHLEVSRPRHAQSSWVMP